MDGEGRERKRKKGMKEKRGKKERKKASRKETRNPYTYIHSS